MMQAADPGQGNDFRIHCRVHLCIATRRSLFSQPEMRPVVVVVVNVLGHEPFQMFFVEHDHVVEKIAAAGGDEALSYTVLPRALKTGSLRFHAEVLDRFNNFFVETGAAIEE